jgi:hypothetical protein
VAAKNPLSIGALCSQCLGAGGQAGEAVDDYRVADEGKIVCIGPNVDDGVEPYVPLRGNHRQSAWVSLVRLIAEVASYHSTDNFTGCDVHQIKGELDRSGRIAVA